MGTTTVVPQTRVRQSCEEGDVEGVKAALQLGADTITADVMRTTACFGSPEILQLLIDAGGDVNEVDSDGRPLLFAAVVSGLDVEKRVGVLLAQPTLDLSVTKDGNTADQYARRNGKPSVADLVRNEVRPVFLRRHRCSRGAASWQLVLVCVITWCSWVLAVWMFLADGEAGGTGTELSSRTDVWTDVVSLAVADLWLAAGVWVGIVQSDEQKRKEFDAAAAASAARLVVRGLARCLPAVG